MARERVVFHRGTVGLSGALGRFARTTAVTVSFLLVFAIVALAQNGQAPSGPVQTAQNQNGQDRRQAEPGRFDFYVLALSWSPSYCAAMAERRSGRALGLQCGGRPFSFVVHGLWPQYERGFPSFCQTPAPWVDRTVVDGVLDLMPSPGLVIHEWKRHGTCSGLSAQGYFDLVRQARAAVNDPPHYRDLDKPIMVTPGEVAEAFLKANPGLSQAGLAVSCDSTRLSEVRVCLSKEFKFRDCPEVARRACRRDKVAMPAVRGE